MEWTHKSTVATQGSDPPGRGLLLRSSRLIFEAADYNHADLKTGFSKNKKSKI